MQRGLFIYIGVVPKGAKEIPGSKMKGSEELRAPFPAKNGPNRHFRAKIGVSNRKQTGP